MANRNGLTFQPHYHLQRLEVKEMVSPQIVFTAIQAGLRLYHVGYTAYVDSTRNRALTLPLPRGPNEPSADVAFKFIK
jgi:hypothetical protein